MKAWFYKVYGPYVGCEGYGVVLAWTEQEAEQDVYQLAVENYESYYFDDNEDIEPEYDFLVEEYNPELHDMHLTNTEIEYAKEMIEKFNPHQA